MQPSRNVLVPVLGIFSVIAVVAFLILGAGKLIQTLGGAHEYAPEDAPWLLSTQAQSLVDAAYEGLDDSTVMDHHVHVLSLGQNQDAEEKDKPNRSFVNPELLSWRYPRRRIRSSIYFGAAGADDLDRADALYLSRLIRQVRALPGKQRLQLVALDQRYDSEGEARPAETAAYVDNEYAWRLAEQYPEIFTPAVSIHPWREDAVEALERWAERGVNTVVWSPAAQHFDPAQKRLDDYYQALVDNDMTLLVHGDAAFLADGIEAYANPLRYRRALEKGVRVNMAQLGGSRLFPDPRDEDIAPKPGFEWFLKLLVDPDTGKNLYGTFSGLTRRDQVPEALAAILQRPQVFDKLVYGSGYPMPAVNMNVDLDRLADGGFIGEDQIGPLREIYNVNPLLFDFVLTRTLRLPHTDLGLPQEIFTRRVGRD